MTESEVDLASLLCSRLCHDLLSPVGAMNNGLELLADEHDPEMRKRCMDLLAESAKAAADKAAEIAALKVVNDAANGVEKEITARIFVCPSENTEVVRAAGRFAIAAYLNVPVYAEFHRWLGRGPQLQGMWDAWKAGDRKAALAAIPDEVVDDILIHGSPAQCRAKIQQYFDNGVTTSSLAILGLDPELNYWESVKALSPSAS